MPAHHSTLYTASTHTHSTQLLAARVSKPPTFVHLNEYEFYCVLCVYSRNVAYYAMHECKIRFQFHFNTICSVGVYVCCVYLSSFSRILAFGRLASHSLYGFTTISVLSFLLRFFPFHSPTMYVLCVRFFFVLSHIAVGRVGVCYFEGRGVPRMRYSVLHFYYAHCVLCVSV